MKKYNIKDLTKIVLSAAIAVFAVSCEYQDIADTDYPNQKIYLPSAIDGVYLVNDTNPTTGIYRYELDLANNKLIIPLGVYRSGINNDGNVAVNISINNDTINKIIASGDMIDDDGKNIELIPSSAYSIPELVSISNGSETAIMNLEIDLDYIASQSEKRLALGVAIASSQIEADAEKSLTILELNTHFIVPVPKFTYTVDKTNDKKYTFTNLSTYATSYEWDFGDGSTSTSSKATVEHQFSDFSAYNVKLTVKGISEKPVTYEVPIRVWQNITSSYIKNAGDPFVRSDNRNQLVGNLADWTATDNIKSLTSGVLYGGFLREYVLDGVTYNGVMDFYGKNALTNAKVYQTTTLPAGSYRIVFNTLDFVGTNNCYFAIAKGSTMPDSSEMEGASIINKLHFDAMPDGTQELFFTLDSEQTITLGFVVNTTQAATGKYNELLIKSVGLYK